MYVPDDVKKKVKEIFGKGYTVEILPVFRITSPGRSEQFDVFIEDQTNEMFYFHPFPDDPQFKNLTEWYRGRINEEIRRFLTEMEKIYGEE